MEQHLLLFLLMMLNLAMTTSLQQWGLLQRGLGQRLLLEAS